MPSTSKKQHNFMAAVAKNPGFAKKAGIKQSVGEDFLKADKGKKFGGGGMSAGVNSPKTRHGKMATPNFKAPKFAMGGTVRRFDEGGSTLLPQGLLTPRDQIGGPDISALAAQYRAALAQRQMGGEEAPAPAAPAPAAGAARPRPAAAPAAAPAPNPAAAAATAQKAKHDALVAKEKEYLAAHPGGKQSTGFVPDSMYARVKKNGARVDQLAESFSDTELTQMQQAAAEKGDTQFVDVIGQVLREKNRGDTDRISGYAEQTRKGLRSARDTNTSNKKGREENEKRARVAEIRGGNYAKGGSVESSKMTKKVAGFFAKKGEKKLAAHEYREAAGKEEDTKDIAKKEERALKGAPASMKDYESKEHKAMGMKKGGMASCYANGGKVIAASPPVKTPNSGVTASPNQPTKYPWENLPKLSKYAKGGMTGYKKGGMQGGMHRTNQNGDGIARKGRTGAELVKMASGGMVGARADGIASRGKTKCKIR